ncbi:MAG: D-aminoacyl-tRNA deacylase [Acidimicrobiales bacterium]|nr:D-aminoacyl-tRNA deacylase [Acidimicrobiales bacterium]
MRALVQRVSRASVTVPGTPAGNAVDELVGAIGHGLCVFVGVTHDDGPTEADQLAERLAGLRIMDDADGVMNLSVVDVDGAVLVVSQFTLYGDASKGRRPTWLAAAKPDQAEPLIDRLVASLRERGIEVATGRFRADMVVDLINEGPATLMLET